MKEILILLDAINWLADDLHYKSTGVGFYEKHLLADRLKNLNEFKDQLKETFYLGFKQCVPPNSAGIAKAAIFAYNTICESRVNELQRLNQIFETLLKSIENFKTENIENKIPSGIYSILDKISETALTNKFLVNAESGNIATNN